jgi:hypothetical protein
MDPARQGRARQREDFVLTFVFYSLTMEKILEDRWRGESRGSDDRIAVWALAGL